MCYLTRSFNSVTLLLGISPPTVMLAANCGLLLAVPSVLELPALPILSFDVYSSALQRVLACCKLGLQLAN